MRCKKGTYYNLCVMCLLAAFVPHRPIKYFHVTASNGIVSNSPYTPLAIMTASPNASVRVLDPRCRCRLATLPTPSMIEPITMLTDHPLLAPHRQVRRCHRSIHCWHGHAARRSALPRERFSPLAQSGQPTGNRRRTAKRTTARLRALSHYAAILKRLLALSRYPEVDIPCDERS